MSIHEKLHVIEGSLEDSNHFEVAYPIQVFKISYQFEQKSVDLGDEVEQSYNFNKIQRSAKTEALDLLLKTAHKKTHSKNYKVISNIKYPYYNVLISRSNNDENKDLYDVKIDLNVEGTIFKKINYTKILENALSQHFKRD